MVESENLGKSEYQLTDKLYASSLGQLSEQQITGKEMKMTLLFHTDGTTQSTGFKAEYNRLMLPLSSANSSAVEPSKIYNLKVLLHNNK